MQYKIRESEEFKSKAGEVIGKKMVLKSDEQQNEEPRVTVWLDHPEYATAVVGGTISGVMEKKDSGIKIPNYAGNYINRTLLAEGSAVATTAPAGACKCEDRLAKLETKVFGEAKPAGDIDAEDIPF